MKRICAITVLSLTVAAATAALAFGAGSRRPRTRS